MTEPQQPSSARVAPQHGGVTAGEGFSEPSPSSINRDTEKAMDGGRRVSINSFESDDSGQNGVKRQEAIAQTWSKKGLWLGYIGIALIATATSLEGQTTYLMSIYATSAFAQHSLLSAVSTIQNILLAVLKPPMAKVSNVFGRFEAFTFAVFLYTIGYIQQAASNSVETYAAAQIFYSAGSTGVQVLIQIFIADTSDLLNRALVSSLPDVPYLFTAFAGPELAQTMVPDQWRWGYGLWAIVLPVCFLPLAGTLLYHGMKAKKLGVLPPTPYKGQSAWSVVKTLWFELDFFGLLLVCAAFSLLLIPLTLAAGAENGWRNSSIIAMLVIGFVCLIAIPFWECSPKLAPYAFFPPNLLKSRTVIGGLGIALFYFMAFYLSVFPYYTSYLQVVHNMSVSASGYVTQTFTFASTVTSIVVGLFIKYTKHYKYWVTLGACIYTVGMGLMLAYRTEGAGTGTLVGTQIAVGIGGGMLNVPAQLGVQASVKSHGQVAAVTAVFLTVIQLGGAVGSAISGAIWTDQIPKKLAAYLPPDAQDQATAIYGSITVAKDSYPVGTPARDAINRAYQEVMTTLLIVALCATVPCILFSFLMKNYKLDQIDQHVKGTVIGGKNDDEREPFAQRSARYSDEDESPSGGSSSGGGRAGKLFQRLRK